MGERTAGELNVNGNVAGLNCKSCVRVLKCELIHYFGIARGVNNR